MSLSVKCPCGKTWTVADQLAGKRIKCKACGAALSVGSAESSPPRQRQRNARADDDDDPFGELDLEGDAKAATRRSRKGKPSKSATLFDRQELWAVLTNPNQDNLSSPYGKGLIGILLLGFAPLWFAIQTALQQTGEAIVVQRSQLWLWILGPRGAILLALGGAALIVWGIYQLAAEPESARLRRRSKLKAEPLSLKVKALLVFGAALLCLLVFVQLIDKPPQRRMESNSQSVAATPDTTPTISPPANAVAATAPASNVGDQPASPNDPASPPTNLTASPVGGTPSPNVLETKATASPVSPQVSDFSPTGELRSILSIPREPSFGMVFGMTPDGERVIAGSNAPGELLNIVDVTSKKLTAQLPRPSKADLAQKMVISDDSRCALVLVVGLAPKIVACDLTKSKILGVHTLGLSPVRCLAIAADGTLGCVCDGNRQIEIWEIATDKV